MKNCWALSGIHCLGDREITRRSESVCTRHTFVVTAHENVIRLEHAVARPGRRISQQRRVDAGMELGPAADVDRPRLRRARYRSHCAAGGSRLAILSVL